MEYYEIAAKWWANKIRNVCPGNFNNGDESSTGGIMMMMAMMNAMNSKVTDESINSFEKRLAENIREYVEARGSLTISCDYGPDTLLNEIAKETAIPTNRFPFKTIMWINKGNVSVRAGYGASEKVIFPE